MHETVFCAIGHKNKIADIAINKPNDLILNNFGAWMAGHFRPVSNALTNITVTDWTNVSRTASSYGQGSNSIVCMNNNIGTMMQVGSSTTAPARTDYTIGTAFATAPESAAFNTTTGSWGGGSASFSGAISAGGNGTVNETGVQLRFCDTAGALQTCMLMHDKLASGVAFTAGQTITVSYSIAM